MKGPKLQRARRALSPERIARAALKLIDRRGLEAFSMHKLSASLGCETMSLYHHLKSRGEVMDAVAGLLMAEIQAPTEGTWQCRLRGFAHSYRAVALAHPRAFSLLATRPVASSCSWAVGATVRCSPKSRAPALAKTQPNPPHPSNASWPSAIQICSKWRHISHCATLLRHSPSASMR
jgi:AcrR family transcriptional regulator